MNFYVNGTLDKETIAFILGLVYFADWDDYDRESYLLYGGTLLFWRWYEIHLNGENGVLELWPTNHIHFSMNYFLIQRVNYFVSWSFMCWSFITWRGIPITYWSASTTCSKNSSTWSNWWYPLDFFFSLSFSFFSSTRSINKFTINPSWSSHRCEKFNTKWS